MAGKGRGLDDLGTYNFGKYKDKRIKRRSWSMCVSGCTLCLIRDICQVFPLNSFLILTWVRNLGPVCMRV